MVDSSIYNFFSSLIERRRVLDFSAIKNGEFWHRYLFWHIPVFNINKTDDIYSQSIKRMMIYFLLEFGIILEEKKERVKP